MLDLTAGSSAPPVLGTQTPHAVRRNKAAAAFVVVAALAFCIVLGGVTAAALLICGWGNVESVQVGWWDVTIVCKEDPSGAGGEALIAS